MDKKVEEPETERRLPPRWEVVNGRARTRRRGTSLRDGSKGRWGLEPYTDRDGPTSLVSDESFDGVGQFEAVLR